jgi:hypothetical protein
MAMTDGADSGGGSTESGSTDSPGEAASVKMDDAAVAELRAAVEARTDWLGKVLWRSPP